MNNTHFFLSVAGSISQHKKRVIKAIFITVPLLINISGLSYTTSHLKPFTALNRHL